MYITYWMATVQRLIDTQGIDKVISDIKYIRLITTRYLCGQPIFIPDRIIGINKLGLPKLLGPLQSLAQSTNINDHRFLLTMLSISRALPGSQYLPPLSDITTESTMKQSTYDEVKMLLPYV